MKRAMSDRQWAIVRARVDRVRLDPDAHAASPWRCIACHEITRPGGTCACTRAAAQGERGP